MKILTLTLNPAIDKSTTVDRIVPESKLRCNEPVFEAGGGGINVSRALKKLGGDSVCMYLAGGRTGTLMHQLLSKEGVDQEVIEIKGDTRENFIVVNTSTNEQYRFGMPGAKITPEEWELTVEKLKNLDPFPEFLVASGSIPKSLTQDAYATIADIVKSKGGKLVLDTSDVPLKKAMEEVGVYMIKPNLRELGQLAGVDEIHGKEQEEIAQNLIKSGKVNIIVASLGARGAMMATKDHIEYIVPPTIKKRSTVGAGDSMVAGMLLKMSEGKNWTEVLKFGVASGTAATMNEGTQLCSYDDVIALYHHLISDKKIIPTV